MKKLFEKLKKKGNNKGMTFVEIICAVAILGLVSSTIGGVITVGTNTYRKGVSETNIQQEAQLAANNISNIVKDAYKVVYAEAGGTYLENGKPMYEDDGTTVKTNTSSYTELSLLTNGYMQYTVLHDTTTGELWYGEIDLTNISETYTFTPGSDDMELMASNITEFTAETGEFEDNRTITLEMTVKDDSTGREIPMTYTMKSRNESGSGVAYTAVSVSEAIYVENKVVLVPGEEYTIPIALYGTTQAPTYSVSSTDLSVESISTESVTVKVADDPSGDTVQLNLSTEDGTSTYCLINIRRVKDVQVGYKVDTSSSEESGAAYTFTAVVSGNQLTKWIGYDCDANYKTAQAVTWSWELTADGNTYTGDTESAWENEYLELGSYTEDAVYPQLVMTLKQDMPSDFSLTVRATSKHAKGVNKADSDYYQAEYGECTVEKGEDELITVSGEWKRGGTVSIAYNIPEENLVTEYNEDGSIKSQYLVDDEGNYWGSNDIATMFQFMTKYENNSHSAIYYQSRGLSSGYRPNSALYLGGDANVLTDYTATLIADADDETQIKLYSYSSPYPDVNSWNNYWLDITQIYMKVNIGGGSYVNATNTIAVGEVYYDVADVVFQYTNALPATSTLAGDDDGEWTNKKGDNTLVVYVTPDDTIDSYTSYYKLSEGWEETYEEYTLLTDRYVGVISDVEGTENDERLWNFEVTNTTGTGADAGRSYVSFTFSNPNDYVGKVVQMIYEYNPFFCDESTNYGQWRNFDLDKLDEVDGCEGILEFHFVDANITGSGTLPEVRYCPTFDENKANGASGTSTNYYYISTTSRFKINSNGTAEYQTTTDPVSGSWPTVGNMTYSDGNWTYSAVNN